MELEGYFAMADGLVDSKSIMLLLEVTEHQCHASTDNCKIAKFLCEERTMFFLEKTSIYNPLEESVYNLEDLIGICTHD